MSVARVRSPTASACSMGGAKVVPLDVELDGRVPLLRSQVLLVKPWRDGCVVLKVSLRDLRDTGLAGDLLLGVLAERFEEPVAADAVAAGCDEHRSVDERHQVLRDLARCRWISADRFSCGQVE